MKPADDPFLARPAVPQPAVAEADGTPLDLPLDHPPAAPAPPPTRPPTRQLAPTLARLHGFDLTDQPLLSAVPACPGELITARSAIALRRAQIGHEVVITCLDGDPRQPVILGVIERRPLRDDPPSDGLPAAAAMRHALVDGERQVIEAEREVVLRCGEASITLTRAGKVILQGRHILSRSSGANRIKGACVDIN